MSSDINVQGNLVPPVLDTRPLDIRSSTSRKHKRNRGTPGQPRTTTNGMVTSPRNRSRAASRHPLSPRDGTQVIVNGMTVDKNSIDPIVIPSPMLPTLRPASPRAAVPGILSAPQSPKGHSRPTSPRSPGRSSRRTPSRISSQSPNRAFISPASPTAFIPTENPAITNVGDHVAPFIPSISSIRSPLKRNRVEESSSSSEEEEEEEEEEIIIEEEVKEPKNALGDEEEEVESEQNSKEETEKGEVEAEVVTSPKEDEIQESPDKLPSLPKIEEEDTSQTTPKDEEKSADDTATTETAENKDSTPPSKEEENREQKQDPKPRRRKRKRKKKEPKVKTYKSSVPPFLGPVLNVPDIPDYASMPSVEQVQWREEFRIKFGLLRSAFRDYSIPDIDPEEPLEMVHARYERYIRHIHISGAADSYRNYLILMFLIIELLATQILGLPCNGYTMAQMRSMSKYERLLIELGEKWYVPGGSDWPVEYRIIFLALFNALVFMGMKWLAKYVGEGAAEALVNAVIGGAVSNDSGGSTTETGDSGGAGGGFDLGSLIGGIASMLGNNGKNGNNFASTPAGGAGGGSGGAGGNENRRRRRGPLYKE